MALHYNVGFAAVDITPPVGIYLAGLSRRTKPSDGVYHPLRAVAVAIDDGAQPILLITAEWLGFYDLVDRTRGSIFRATGIPGERVLLMGTHTHCGPALRPLDLHRGCPLDADYIQRSIDAIAACAQLAMNRRAPTTLSFGEGHCTFGASRRRPDANGKALYKLHRPGPHDHRVPFLAAHAPDGALRGVLFNYACHPTAMFGTQIGGDYVCFASDLIESTFPGTISCFLPGCGGDQKPAPPEMDADDFREHTLEELRARGHELARTILDTIRAKKLAPIINGPIEIRQHKMTLTTMPVDKADVEAQLKSTVPAYVTWAQTMLEAERTNKPIPRDIPFEIQTIRFGRSLVIPAFSAEMSVEYGTRLRQDLAADFDHIIPVAYANDILGYVPTRKQIPGGGYEVADASRYYSRTGPYVEETEEIVHAAVRRMLPSRGK